MTKYSFTSGAPGFTIKLQQRIIGIWFTRYSEVARDNQGSIDSATAVMVYKWKRDNKAIRDYNMDISGTYVNDEKGGVKKVG